MQDVMEVNSTPIILLLFCTRGSLLTACTSKCICDSIRSTALLFGSSINNTLDFFLIFSEFFYLKPFLLKT